MRAIICGANGAMGKLIRDILGEEVIGLVSIDGENNVPKTFGELGKLSGDVIIDFSHHSAVADVLRYAKENGFAAVIGKKHRRSMSAVFSDKETDLFADKFPALLTGFGLLTNHVAVHNKQSFRFSAWINIWHRRNSPSRRLSPGQGRNHRFQSQQQPFCRCR